MKKLLLTLTLLLTLGFAASAAEVTESLTSNPQTLANGDIKVSYSNALVSSGHIRVYTGSTVTIEGEVGVTITKIAITTSGSDTTYPFNISADTGSFTGKTWNGEANKVIFTNNSSKQVRFASFTITYSKEALTECPAPVFSVEDGDEVFQGQTITVNKKDATSVQLYVNDVEVEGESYTVPTDAAFGSFITLTAVSTLEGEGVTVPTNTTTITVTVAEKKVYTLLADIADLYDGAKGYIVCTSQNVIMGAQNSGNYRDKINLNDNAIGDGVLSEVPDGAEMVTFVKDGANYVLKVGDDSYLCLTSNANNLFTGSNPAADTITVSGSDATIAFTSYPSRSIRYNASAPRFACYTGTQQPVQIYIEPKAEPETELVGFTHEESFGKTVVRVEYMLHLNNHKDANEYTVVLSVGDHEFTNAEHSDASIVEETANAPMRALNPNDVASETTLKGTILATGLEGETSYGEANLVAKLGDKELGRANIAEFTTGTTGIEDVIVEGNEAAEYFNLQGVRVAQPEAGQIYIVRRGAKATKELVK